MAARVRRDTGPELAVRTLLHAAGLRYRVAYRVPGRARRTIDVAFTRARVAVFVDGCFWHGCPAHGVRPTSNSEWWRSKIEANQARDRDTSAYLESLGWRVLRFWEHQDAGQVVDSVTATVRSTAVESAPTDALHAARIGEPCSNGASCSDPVGAPGSRAADPHTHY